MMVESVKEGLKKRKEKAKKKGLSEIIGEMGESGLAYSEQNAKSEQQDDIENMFSRKKRKRNNGELNGEEKVQNGMGEPMEMIKPKYSSMKGE